MKEIDSKIRLIDLEKVETSDIWAVFANYYLEGLLAEDHDGDGDIIIERSQRIYGKVDPSYGMLRFFSYMMIERGQDNPPFLEMLSDINAASSSIKYSFLGNSVMAEYGIPLAGSIDHKHLLKVVEHFAKETSSADMLLRNFIKE